MDSGVRPRSPIVRIPSRPSVSPVFSPTPHSRPTGNGSRNPSDAVRRHHEHPVGLAVVGRELRDELRGGDADRARHADLALDVGPDLRRDLGRGSEQHRGARDVQERLVERDRLHERGVGAQDLAEPMGVGAVRLEVRRQEDDVGAQAPGPDRRHRGAHAVLPGLVGRRGDHAARAGAADDDRLPGERRILQDLDGRVERVDVDVQDRLGAHPAEPGLECQSRRAGRAGSVGASMASRKRPSPLARCSAVRSQTSSAMILTPFTPVRRSCPHTAIAYEWNTVFATFGWTDSKTVTSTGPVASSSVRKMIRWPLRIAGVCEATFTPATMTFCPPRHACRSFVRVTPRSAQERLEERDDVARGVQAEHLELRPHDLGVGVVGEPVRGRGGVGAA